MTESAQSQLTVDYVKSVVDEFVHTGCSTTSKVQELLQSVLHHKYNEAVEYFWNHGLLQVLTAMLHMEKTDKNKKIQTDAFNLIYEIIRQLKNGYRQGLTIDNLVACFSNLLFSGNSLYIVDYGKLDKMSLIPLLHPGCHIFYSNKEYEVYRVEAEEIYVRLPSNHATKYKIRKNDKGINIHLSNDSLNAGYEAWLHSLRANSPVDIFYNDQWISATVIGLTQDDMGSLSLIVRYAPMDVNHEEHGIAYIQPEKEFVLPYMSMSRGSTLNNTTPSFNYILNPPCNMTAEAKDANSVAAAPSYTYVSKALLIILNYIFKNKLWQDLFELVEKNIRYLSTSSFLSFFSTVANTFHLLNQSTAKQYVDQSVKIFKLYIDTFKFPDFSVPDINNLLCLYDIYSTLLNRFHTKSDCLKEVDSIALHTTSVLFHTDLLEKHQLALSLISVLQNWIDDAAVQPSTDLLFDPSLSEDGFTDVLYKHSTQITESSIAQFFIQENLFNQFILSPFHVDQLQDASRFIQICLKFDVINEDQYKVIVDEISYGVEKWINLFTMSLTRFGALSFTLFVNCLYNKFILEYRVLCQNPGSPTSPASGDGSITNSLTPSSKTFRRTITSSYLSSKAIEISRKPILPSSLLQLLHEFIPYIDDNNKALLLKFILSLSQSPSALNSNTLQDYQTLIKTLYSCIYFGKLRSDLIYNLIQAIGKVDNETSVYYILLLNSLLNTYCETEEQLKTELSTCHRISLPFTYKNIFTLDNTLVNESLPELKDAPYVLSKDMILSKYIELIWEDLIENLYTFIHHLFEYLEQIKPKTLSRLRTRTIKETSENQYYLNTMFTLENVIALYFHCLTILLNHSPDSCNLSQSQMQFLMTIPKSDIASVHLELTLNFIQNIQKFSMEDYKFMLNALPSELLGTLSTHGWNSFYSLFNSLNCIPTETSTFQYMYPPVCEDILFNVIKLCQNDIVLKNALNLLQQYYEYMTGGYENHIDFLQKNIIYTTILKDLSTDLPLKILKRYIDILKTTFSAIYQLEENPLTLDRIRCGEIVNITITSNTTFNVSVPYNYKIYLLKQEIAARLQKDGSQFSLQYTNIELEETSSLDAYHIQNKSNIYVLENTHEHQPCTPLPVSAPLVSITFTRSSNLYELLVSILNNKKKERLSTFLWQLLCMMPLWSTQVQLIEQLSTYTLSSEEALTEIWAQIFPEDIYICNYNMTILEWKISRDYELFYNRDVYYKGTTKEQEGKDLTLFILMMKSGFLPRVLSLVDQNVNLLKEPASTSLVTRFDSNPYTAFYKAFFLNVFRAIYSGFYLYYMTRERDSFLEFLSNMNFNERDFTSLEETQTRLTVAQVKTKDYISLHTATYVYFNEDDMHLMMEIYPDVEELMDLLKDSLQQLSTWTEPNYIIQLFHHLFTLSLAKNVNVYDPLLYFLYKLEALLLITNDHIDLVKSTITSMLTDYLHPLLPPFLSECSCFDIYNVAFTFNDPSLNETIFQSIIDMFFDPSKKNEITEPVSRLLVECLQYIESTLPDVIVLDCIHKISDYINHLTSEQKPTILLKIISLFSSLLDKYKKESQEMKDIVQQFLDLVLIPSTPLPMKTVTSTFSFIQNYFEQTTQLSILQSILKPLGSKELFMNTLLSTSLPSHPYYLNETSLGVEKELNSYMGLTCDVHSEESSTETALTALTPTMNADEAHGRLDYLFCIFQILYLNPKLREYVSKTNFMTLHTNLSQLIQELFMTLYCSRYSIADMSRIYSYLLSIKENTLDFRKQQDPLVFMTWLLHYLKNTNNSYKSSQILDSVYTGEISETFRCDSCGERFTETHLSEHIDVDIKDSRSLRDCIDNYFLKAIQRQYSCSHCNNTNTTAQVLRTLLALPETLIFKLNRFVTDKTKHVTTKISSFCDIPFDLNLYKYSQEGFESQGQIRDEKKNPLSNYQYELRYIVIHDGQSLDNGHFYLLYKERNKDLWYKMDDDRVVVIEEAAVKGLMTGGEEVSTRSTLRQGLRRKILSASTASAAPKMKTYCAYLCIYEKEAILNDYSSYSLKDLHINFQTQQQSLYTNVLTKNTELVAFKTSTQLPFVKFICTLSRLFGNVFIQEKNTEDYKNTSQFIYQSLYSYSIKILSRLNPTEMSDSGTNYISNIFTYMFNQLKYSTGDVFSMVLLLSNNFSYILSNSLLNPNSDIRRGFLRILAYSMNYISTKDQLSTGSALCRICELFVSKELFKHLLLNWNASEDYLNALHTRIVDKNNNRILIYFYYNNILANMINAYIEGYEEYHQGRASVEEEDEDVPLCNFFALPSQSVVQTNGKSYFDIIYLLISLLPDLSPSDSLRSQMFLKNTIEMLTISTTKASSYLSRTKEKPVELGLKLTPDSYSAMHNTTFYIYALKSSYRMIVLKIIHYIATKNMNFYEQFLTSILDYVKNSDKNESYYATFFNSVLLCRPDNKKFGYEKRIYDIYLKDDGLLNQLEYLPPERALHTSTFILNVIRDNLNTSKIYSYYQFSNVKWDLVEEAICNDTLYYGGDQTMKNEIEHDQQLFTKYIHKLTNSHIALDDIDMMMDDDLNPMISDMQESMTSMPPEGDDMLMMNDEDDDMLMMDADDNDMLMME